MTVAVQRTIILPIESHPALATTLEEAHKAYRLISKMAFESKTYARYSLQKLSYAEVRAATTLTAQMTCSAIRKVSSAYKSMKSNKRLPDEPARFEKRCLDLEGGSRGRDFRLYPDKGIVSISTVDGRKKLAYRCGDFQRGYLESPEWTIQAAKLIYKRRRPSRGWRYELHVTVVRVQPEQRAGGILGVDTGRRYLAVASTGQDAAFFPAGHLKPKKELPALVPNAGAWIRLPARHCLSSALSADTPSTPTSTPLAIFAYGRSWTGKHLLRTGRSHAVPKPTQSIRLRTASCLL